MEKLLCVNKKAKHDYFILDTFETGIVLVGTEVKSIKIGNANIRDAFIKIKNNEIFIENMHIYPFEQGNRYNVDSLRTRKLLMHKNEIKKLSKKLKDSENGTGITIIPLKIYLVKNKIKLEIALAKGKKNYDKRQALKEKDQKRQIEKSLKKY